MLLAKFKRGKLKLLIEKLCVTQELASNSERRKAALYFCHIPNTCSRLSKNAAMQRLPLFVPGASHAVSSEPVNELQS